MGKNKQQSNTEAQKQEETNNNGVDENPNDTKNKSNKQNNEVIVLGVYLHCQGCVETVVKSLRGFEGVEEIEPNTKEHRVTVKGKAVDPNRVANRVKNKSGKDVHIISPVPKKQQEKKVEKKPEAAKVVETLLKMHIHCEGCAKDVKHCLHKMQGVQTVNVDTKESLVMVKGTVDPKEVVKYISKRTGRHTEMVNVKNNKNNNNKEGNHDQKKEKEKNNNNNNNSAFPHFPPDLVYAPQLFSDENPNACSIM